ncbi:MAG: aminoglycoside phosphotransferase family protein, partial [Myxococcota bacterium]|nr:aminoglycoside phosphotransferase family protein [Myxococcota bacterium]
RACASAIARDEDRFDNVERWALGFKRCRPLAKGKLSEDLLDRAEATYLELLASDPERILLHGDLHHDNVLFDAQRGWCIIDPKGVLGPPAYESGAMLRNPPGVHERADLDVSMRRRVEILHEVLGDDPEVIIAWAFSQIVLSILWMLEDNQPGWESDYKLALCFDALRAP